MLCSKKEKNCHKGDKVVLTNIYRCILRVGITLHILPVNRCTTEYLLVIILCTEHVLTYRCQGAALAMIVLFATLSAAFNSSQQANSRSLKSRGLVEWNFHLICTHLHTDGAVNVFEAILPNDETTKCVNLFLNEMSSWQYYCQ